MARQALFEQHDGARACELFTSYGQCASADPFDAHLGLALCHELQNQLAAAYSEVQSAQLVENVRPHAAAAPNLLHGLMDRLEPQVAFVQVQLDPPVNFAALRTWLDSKPIESEGLRAGLAVDPGTHRIMLAMLGYRPVAGTFTAERGQRVSLAFALRLGSSRCADLGDAVAPQPGGAWFYVELHGDRDDCEPSHVFLWSGGARVDAERLPAGPPEPTLACIAVRVPDQLRPPALEVTSSRCEEHVTTYDGWTQCWNAATPCVYEMRSPAEPASAAPHRPPESAHACGCRTVGSGSRRPPLFAWLVLVAAWTARGGKRVRRGHSADDTRTTRKSEISGWLAAIYWLALVVFLSGLGLAYWRNTLSDRIEDALAMGVAVASGVLAPVALWLFKEGSRLRERLPRAGALLRSRYTIAAASAALFAGGGFAWANAMRAQYISFDCGAPPVPNFKLVVGSRDLTAACGIGHRWVDPRASVDAYAPDYEPLHYTSVSSALRDQSDVLVLRLHRTSPWRCSVTARGPALLDHCNGAPRGHWSQGVAFQLHLEGQAGDGSAPLRFVLRARDTAHGGVGFAGIRGCVVLDPQDPSSPSAEIQTTAQCVKLTADRARVIDLTAYACSDLSGAPADFAEAATLTIYETSRYGNLDVECSP